MDQVINRELKNEMYWVKGLTDDDHRKLINLPEKDSMSAQEVLIHASKGLALKGILVGADEPPSPCEIVLEPPNPLVLEPTSIRQTVDDVRLHSAEEISALNYLVQNVGFCVSYSMEKESLKYTQKAKDQAAFTYNGLHTTFPVAQCMLDQNQLKLSLCALKEAKMIQKEMSTSKDKDKIYSSCKTFLERFGSHVICGDVHFGGVYSWEATCDGDNADQGDLVKQTLDNYIFNGDTSSSQVHLVKSTHGGPSSTPTVDLWKLGLETDPNTWVVIDREKTYVGIWDILLNHRNDIENVQEVAFTLEKVYEKDISLKRRQIQGRTLLDYLELADYHPAKISLAKVMQLERGEKICTRKDIAWNLLRKLIMLDQRALTSEILNFQTVKDETVEGLNPLDVFLTIFACCDLNLRQVLVQKMMHCRLAFPFIFPGLHDAALTYSLWPLRSLIIQYMDDNKKAIETSLTSSCPDVVSFVRLGRPKVSKSWITNYVLTEQFHDTFFNFECPKADTKRILSDGYVEASFSLPAGKPSDAMDNATLFLNLRGDAANHGQQANVLGKMSDVAVVCVDIEDLGSFKNRETMKPFFNVKKGVIFLLTNRKGYTETEVEKHWSTYEQTVKPCTIQLVNVLAFKNGEVKNKDELKRNLRNEIKMCLTRKDTEGIDWNRVTKTITAEGIQTDEDDEHCKEGKRLADRVTSSVKKFSVNTKREMLPLQGDLWKEWNELLKKKKRHVEKSDSLDEKSKIQKRMDSLRTNQAQRCMKPTKLMENFISSLYESVDKNCTEYLLHWLKLHFDDVSRETLPSLWNEYNESIAKYRRVKKGKTATKGDLTELEKQKTECERRLSDATLGVEHLFRELGQMYEATLHCKTTYNQHIRRFPELVAKLILQGQTLEIMDGDASGVPTEWLKAVLSSMSAIVKKKKKKIFTLSVLGIQSTGKTTLLNTMFGLQLPVSAGRCTRGVYMRLIEPKPGSNLPFDYLMVLDTEGLRAPEIGDSSYDHDNELATFIIGLGDSTILNIKGENLAEVKDILQIVVHAFLRMSVVSKAIQKSRSCIFIHQNVPALDAEKKMKIGHTKFTDALDEMTTQAATLEKMSSIKTFSEVINFEGPGNVWYFSDLWNGDLPMAAANPGYHEKVQQVKDLILGPLAKKREVNLDISQLIISIQDMWKGVLADDFIFCFRNSLVAMAYNRLEHEYVKLKWELESSIRNWLHTTVCNMFQNCHSDEKIYNQKQLQSKEAKDRVDQELKKAIIGLETFIDKDEQKSIIVDWKEDKKSSLKSAAECMKGDALFEINRMALSQRVASLHETKLEKHKREISQKARQLAAGLKGQKKVDDHTLKRKFDDLWQRCIENIPVEKSERDIDIWKHIKDIVHDEYPDHSQNVRKEFERQGKLEGGKQNLVIRGLKSLFPIFFTSDTQTNPITESVESNLKTLNKKTSRFDPKDAKELIKTVKNQVRSLEENPKHPINIHDEIEIVVAACKRAKPEFEKMHGDYIKNHGVKANLERYRKTLWNMFVSLVKERTEEVALAVFIRDQIEEPIKVAVKNKLHEKVVQDIVPDFYTKSILLRTILQDLAEKEEYTSFQSYISTPKVFTLKWLTQYTDAHIEEKREGSSWYKRLVETYTKDICDRLGLALHNATDNISMTKKKSLTNWIAFLVQEMGSTIALPTGMAHHMQEHHAYDFENLRELLLEERKTIETNIAMSFEQEITSGITWMNKTPYEEILDSLWGCEAECPFCHEPCKRSDVNHGSETDCHECVQHRPRGVTLRHWLSNNELVIESCNFGIQSNARFKCVKSDHVCKPEEKGEFHSYKKYTDYYPKWNIPPSPDMEASHFWMWYMNKFIQDIADASGLKVPDIPESWADITKERAIESLMVYA